MYPLQSHLQSCNANVDVNPVVVIHEWFTSRCVEALYWVLFY